jgi:membrane-associated phospholipid phosphatase
MTSIEREIVRLLYAFASGNQWLRLAAVSFGHWSGYVIAPAFVFWTLAIWRRTGRPTLLVQAVLAAVSSRIVLEIIRFTWDIKRPFVTLGIQPLFDPFENGPSLPSGHATFYFALAAVAWHRSKKISAALFTAALLMGIGRVAAAVHWPADIIAGAIIGITAGLLTRRLILSS